MLGNLKDTLNDRASTVFGRLGYSDQRTRDAKREAWWWFDTRSKAARGRGVVAGHAVVWTHPGRCELLPVEASGPAPDEVTIEIVASIVSTGTERSTYSGAAATRIRYPYRPGYSAAGVVVATGGKAGLSVGDRVAASVPHASVATIPASLAYPVAPGVPLPDAAFVQLGVIARRGVAVAEIESGQSVCVIGSGVVGALALRLAVAAGAGDVTAVARSRRREHVARAGGAGTFLAVGDGSSLEDVAADVVIDATGDPQGIFGAVSAARPGGRLVLLGSPRGVTVAAPVAEIRAKRLTVVGAHISTLTRGDSPAGAVGRESIGFLDQLADGSVQVSDLVDVDVDPRDAPAFYRALPGAGGITAAMFDWTRLTQTERVQRRNPLRLPDLAARGVGYRDKPLALRGGGGRLVDDPLAGASGMLRVALLGCGDIGEQNAGAIAQATNARLVACFDPLPALADELATRYGVDAVRSVEEVLSRDDVDAVFLSVPHDLHAPLAIQAAQAGCHVIVEKPPAQSLDATVEMVSAVRRAGVSLTVCFPHRYDAGVLAARRLISGGAIGELEGTLTSFLSDKPPSYWHGGFSGRAASDWRASRARAGGGVLIMNLSHYVDLGLYLAGTEVESVSAFVSSNDPGAEVEDAVTVSIRYANGAVGSVFGSSAVPGTWEGRGSTELRLWGSDGHVSIEGGREAFSLKGSGGLRAGRWHSLADLPAVPLRTAFVTRFATALDRGVPADVGVEDALAVQAFVEAAYRSAADGVPVRPGDLLRDALARVDATESGGSA